MRVARVVLAVCLAAYAAFGLPRIPIASGPARVVSIKEPSNSMKATVRQVSRVVAKMSPIDRLWLQNIYLNASRVVAVDGIADPPVVTTTEGLRAIHVAILKFIWRGMADNAPGEYDGLKAAIENAFIETVGDTQRPLTPELRQKASDLFDAIAWAGLGKDE